MHDKEQLPDDLTDLVQALSALTPSGSHLNRDRLMYEAGRAAALAVAPTTPAPAWQRFAWPTATAVSTLAATVLAVVLVLTDEPHFAEQVVDRHADSSPPATESATAVHGPDDSRPQDRVTEPKHPAPGGSEWTGIPDYSSWLVAASPLLSEHLALRARVIRHGVDALPQRDLTNVVAVPSQPSMTARQLLDELLPKSSRPRAVNERERNNSPTPRSLPTGQAAPTDGLTA